MAITAKFQADFSSFTDAVRKADAQLVDFSRGADRVGTSLNRMVDSFSGRKVIQDATLMAEAVERVGGASKLTESELARVTKTTNEAAAKLRAMGLDVPLGLKKIADETKTITLRQSDMIANLKNVAAAFGAAFSVQTITRFIGRVLDAASDIDDLSKKMGISIEATQRFKFAAEQTGSSLETVGGAINFMNKTLSEGKDSTVEVLKAAGLEFATLRAMKPEEAFKAIAAAIQAIPDPMRQAEVAMRLLGRAGADLLPGIKEGFVDIGKSAKVMADSTVENLARAQDAWTALGNTVVSVTGNVMAQTTLSVRQVISSWKSFFDFAANVLRFGPGGAGALAALDAAAADALRRMSDIQLPSGRRPTSQADLAAADRLAKEALREQIALAEDYRNLWNDIGMRRLEQEGKLIAMLETERRLVSQSGIVGATGTPLELFSRQFSGIGALAPGGRNPLAASGGGILESFRGGIRQMFNIADHESISGSNIFRGSIGRVGKGILDGFGNMISGGITSLINLGFGALMKGVGKLFGRDEESQQVNPLRDKFIAAAGGLDELNKRAHRAGMTLEAMLKADTVKEYEAAIRDLQDALDFQDQSWRALMEAVDRYGLSISQLGPALSQQMLDQQAQQLIMDFRLLEGAGVDVETISTAMAAALNEYFQNAIRAGATIPAHMKPILHQLAVMGLLYDENGNQIADLEAAGVEFGDTMDEKFSSLIDKINEMIDAIGRLLGITLETGDAINNLPTPPSVPEPPGGPPRGPDRPDVQSFAAGTAGRYLNFGGGTLAMLHGRERVMTAGESVQDPAVAQALADIQRELRLLPRHIRDAVLLAA